MFYFLTFFISTAFIKASSFFEREKTKIIKYFLVFFAIFVLALVSGIRDYSIGTDTTTYNSFYSYVANSQNIFQYCKSLKSIEEIEYGFSILNYMIGMTGVSPHFFYFICQCIIALNVYFSLEIMKDNLNITLGWLTYCFMFYTSSFNILRQIIALSFILLGVALLYNRKKEASLFVILIGCLFHTTAIIGIFIYLTGVLIMRAKNKYQLILSILFLTFIVFLMPSFLTMFSNSGLFSEKYSQYLVEGTQTSLIMTIGSRLPMIFCVPLCLVRNKGKFSSKNLFIYVIIIFELVMLPLQNISSAVARVLLCFGIVKVIGYPLILKQLNVKCLPLKFLIDLLFILYLGIVFYLQVIVSNNGMVYPFVFSR